MSPTQNHLVLHEAEQLDLLASALEKESAAWIRYDTSNEPKFPSREYTSMEEERKKREAFFWNNAVAAGTALSNLYDAGAFEHETRLKNAIGHMRAEMNRCRRENKAPLYSPGRKRPAWPGWSVWSEAAHETFLVKMFEGFCKIWAKSYEDRRAFMSCYNPLKDKTAFHVKVLRGLSKRLKERY